MATEISGKVIEGVGGRYAVLCDDGTRKECRAKGILRREENRLLCGDNVRVLCGEGSDEIVVSSIEPRKNSLLRPPIANLDMLFLVTAAADPIPATETLDKMTLIMEENAIETLLVVTKSDIDPAAAAELSRIYTAAGYRVFVLSSVTGEGVDALSAYIKETLSGRTAAFAGASGVGKSTLLNRIFPSLALETGAISEKTARGKHTTRRTDLFPLHGGFIADTPGFSMLDFTRFDFFPLAHLAHNFREFRPHLDSCRYTDCTHTKEEECGVRMALSRGEIEGSRFQSFLSLYAELRAKNPYGK